MSGSKRKLKRLKRGKTGKGTAGSRRAGDRHAVRGQNGRGAGEVSDRRGGGGSATIAKRLTSPRFLLVILLIALFLGIALKPTMRNLEATSELKRKEEELKAQKSVTSELREQVKSAHTSEYVELKAREQGLILPGETLYVITSEAEKDEEAPKRRVRGLRSMDEVWERVSSMMNCTHEREGTE